MSDATLDDDDYEDFEEDFADDEDDERGLSGLVVLLMGVIMLGAVASVVWIAYKHGIRTGEAGNTTPYVAADPEEPLKIENRTADAAEAVEREVYDRFDGETSEPVEVIAAGPEEPVERELEDPIGAIASGLDDTVNAADDAVADRIASLEASDNAITEAATGAVEAVRDRVEGAVSAAPESTTPSEPVTTPSVSPSLAPTQSPNVAVPTPTAAGALSGTHLVQVGAFRSEDEANGVWGRMETKLGGYLATKSKDIEVADLGDKGTFYRLRIGPFSSSDAAKTYCVGLKERGQDCLVRAKP